MTQRAIKVWVQRFRDRPTLQLQWLDPNTGQRKTRSAGTTEAAAAEIVRAALERELNGTRAAELVATIPATETDGHGLRQQPSGSGRRPDPDAARHAAEAWYAQWKSVWEAISPEDRAKVIEQARAENPLFTAGQGPEDYRLVGICLRILESRAAREKSRPRRRQRQ
jgi:hypothetical protein